MMMRNSYVDKCDDHLYFIPKYYKWVSAKLKKIKMNTWQKIILRLETIFKI